VFKWQICFTEITNLLQLITNIRKSHRQPQCNLQLLCEDRVMFVWVIFTCLYAGRITGEVLGDKSTVYIRVTLYWGYLIVLWLFHLVCILYCGCFVNMCACIYCVLVLFRLCIFILICFVCTGVRTTATEWQLNCSK